MKRLALLVLLIFLTGCGKNDALTKGLELRNALLEGKGCSFTAQITADYGDEIHRFVLEAESDSAGDIQFEVTEPESISGIQGKLAAKGGEILFDETALAFPLLADQQLSPVSAPWVFLRALRSGNLRSAGTEEDLVRLTLFDSFEEDALLVDVWLDKTNVPVQADILYADRRILTLSIKDFHILPSEA